MRCSCLWTYSCGITANDGKGAKSSPGARLSQRIAPRKVAAAPRRSATPLMLRNHNDLARIVT